MKLVKSLMLKYATLNISFYSYALVSDFMLLHIITSNHFKDGEFDGEFE